MSWIPEHATQLQGNHCWMVLMFLRLPKPGAICMFYSAKAGFDQIHHIMVKTCGNLLWQFTWQFGVTKIQLIQYH